MLIGVVGPAGSGKSKVAAYLRNYRGFHECSFAAPIKEFVGRAFGFSDYQLYGPSEARNEPHPTKCLPNGDPLTARVACKVVGTDVARLLYENVWVDMAMRDVLRHLSNGQNVVIADARFKNELAAIRASGGLLIRRTSDKPVTDLHPSEQELLSMPDGAFDACIPRLATIEQLHATVDRLVTRWRSAREAAE
jgi:hypothetical protein